MIARQQFPRIPLDELRPGMFVVEIFDAGGRRVRGLTAGVLAAGPHAVGWNGRDDGGRPAPPGIYFARLHTARGSISRRLVRLE